MSDVNDFGDVNDFNAKMIEEFRTNGGKVSGPLAGTNLLLITTTGAKTGQTRVNPVAFRLEDGQLYIFASKAGHPSSPDWYHNLVAHPQVTVELGNETFEATARVLTGPERDEVFSRQAQEASIFAEYQAKTSRVIPVVALDRAG